MTETPAQTRTEKIVQFIKYCMVGVLNTLITYGVIYLCKSFFGLNIYIGNALGYLAGITNSFLCNKQWVFKSNGNYFREAMRFVCGAGLCYLIQLAVVWALMQGDLADMEFSYRHIVVSGYGIATVIGNVVYTLANFIYNRMVTFK